MGFIGGGGNIAIATILPLSSVMYCIVNITQFILLLYIIFYVLLEALFLEAETNPGPRRHVPVVCRILCSNVRDLAGNLSDLTVA